MEEEIEIIQDGHLVESDTANYLFSTLVKKVQQDNTQLQCISNIHDISDVEIIDETETDFTRQMEEAVKSITQNKVEPSDFDNTETEFGKQIEAAVKDIKERNTIISEDDDIQVVNDDFENSKKESTNSSNKSVMSEPIDENEKLGRSDDEITLIETNTVLPLLNLILKNNKAEKSVHNETNVKKTVVENSVNDICLDDVMIVDELFFQTKYDEMKNLFIEEDLKDLLQQAVKDKLPRPESKDPLKTKTDNTYTTDGFLKCHECLFMSKSKVVMEDHERSTHSGEVRFQCGHCEYKSFFKYDAAAHHKQVHVNEDQNIKGIGCELCSNGDSHVQCDFLKLGDDDTNECNDDPSLFKCEECKYSTKKNYSLNEHIKIVHKREVRYMCSECDYKSFEKKGVSQHQKNIHKSLNPRIIGIDCKLCDEKQSHPQCTFIQNLNYIKGDDPKKKGKSIGSSLKIDNTSDGFRKCEDCSFMSKSKHVMEDHHKHTHSDEVRFQCGICEYKSFFKFNVAAHHENMHFGESTNIFGIGCKLCSNGSNHTQCDFLLHGDDKVKNFNSDLNTEKCEECKFSTTRKFQLTSHIRIVHRREVRYSCSDCDYRTFDKKGVAKHIQSIHKSINSRIIGIDCTLCEEEEAHEQCSFIQNKNDMKKDDNKHEEKFEDSKQFNEARFQCGICNFNSYFKFDVVGHHDKVHTNEKHKIFGIGCQLCSNGDSHVQCDFLINGEENGKDCNTVLNAIKCEECNFSSTKSYHLMIHIRRVHKQEVRYSCSECDYTSYERNQVAKHQKTTHESGNPRVIGIGCNFCEEGELHTMCSFVDSKKDIVKNCPSCSFTTRFTRYLTNHQTLLHTENADPSLVMNCIKCEFQTMSDQSLRSHDRAQHLGELRFYCSKDDFKSFYSHHIMQHINSNHKEGGASIKSISCKECSSNIEHKLCFKLRKKLRLKRRKKVGQQVDSTKKEIVMNCNSCSFSTKFKRYLKNHQTLLHGENADPSLVLSCTKCEFQTISRLSIRNHDRAQHLGELRFYCSIDNLKSFYSHHIIQHIKSNHNEGSAQIKKLSCTDCNNNIEHNDCFKLPLQMRMKAMKEGTRIKPELNIQKPVDGGVRGQLVEYHCDNCDYKTVKKGYMRNHKKLNHNENISANDILKCEKCQFQTIISVVLKRHIQVVHNKEVRFTCSVCVYRTFYVQSIKYHIDTLHKDTDARFLLIDCTLCESKTTHTYCESPLSERLIEKSTSETNTKGVQKKHCDRCTYVGSCRQSLIRHIESFHEKLKNFVCSTCNFKSYEKGPIKYHINSAHKDTELPARAITLGCKDCETDISHQCSFLKDKRKRKPKYKPESLHCKVCHYKSATTHREILGHMKVEHPNDKLFQCDSCEYKCNWLPNLKTHTSAMHSGTKFECDICGWKTSWKPPFYEHRRVKHGIFKKNSKYRNDFELLESLCDQCGFSATSRRTMRLHKQSLCEMKMNFSAYGYKPLTFEGAIKYQNTDCCEKHKENPKALAQHIAVVHDRKYRNCTECGFKANSLYHLNTHKYEKHRNGDTICPVCQLKCRNRFNLLIHMKGKHPAAGLNCESCDHKAESIWLLKKHKDSVHFGIQHPCDMCEYKGPGKAELHMHKMRVHKEKYLKCTVCDYMAANYLLLKSHKLETHNLTTNYKLNEDVSHRLFNSNKHIVLNRVYPNIEMFKVSE